MPPIRRAVAAHADAYGRGCRSSRPPCAKSSSAVRPGRRRPRRSTALPSRTGVQERPAGRPTARLASRRLAAWRSASVRPAGRRRPVSKVENASDERRRRTSPRPALPRPPGPQPRPVRASRRAATPTPSRPCPRTTSSSRSPASSTRSRRRTPGSCAPAGYFASPEDVYVANSYVRRFGLRRGDAVTGAIRQPRDGERREKYNPLVRLDTVNGRDPEAVKNRVEFTKLTPLYPQERLRLETEPHILTTRVIDLVMPIGKGQRALIVSPPKAGKTMVLAGDRQRDHRQQPRVPPHGRARRRAAGRSHRHAALGEGRGHRLDVRPPPAGPHHGRGAVHRASQAPRRDGARRRRPARLDHPPRPGVQPGRARRAAASCPVVSTRPRSTRPSDSSARPATSRTAAR